jgi:hypothetical protein
MTCYLSLVESWKQRNQRYKTSYFGNSMTKITEDMFRTSSLSGKVLMHGGPETSRPPVGTSMPPVGISYDPYDFMTGPQRKLPGVDI